MCSGRKTSILSIFSRQVSFRVALEEIIIKRCHVLLEVVSFRREIKLEPYTDSSSLRVPQFLISSLVLNSDKKLRLARLGALISFALVLKENWKMESLSLLTCLICRIERIAY